MRRIVFRFASFSYLWQNYLFGKRGIFMPENKQQPLLTIGMIFKNEIRCLERCLKSLRLLREAVPCELVMADTGSSDGSREIAEKYADILFDFPWINDFAAARNAVMEKSHGKWYLTIDADEWLENIDELVRFLYQTGNRQTMRSGQLIKEAHLVQRNYTDYFDETQKYNSFREDYVDCFAPRMLLMSTGLRYSGAIHEIWRSPDLKGCITKLPATILHHDGYAGLNVNDEAGQAKRERNMILLREQLKKTPEDLRTLSECVDSSLGDERWGYACRIIELLRQKKKGWFNFGPGAFSTAVNAALIMNKYDEAEEWIALAAEMFPKTFMVRLDFEVSSLHISWSKKDYADCVRRGRAFLQAYDDYHAGRGDPYRNYNVSTAGSRWKPHMQIYLAYALFKEGEKERSLALLQKLDMSYLRERETEIIVSNLRDLRRTTDFDTAPILLRLWEKINEPDFAHGEECTKGFMVESARTFLPKNLEAEPEADTLHAPWTLFLPLGEQDKLGLAAKLLEEQNPREMERLLGLVENWDDIIIMAPLARALSAGAKFPVKPMRMLEMDNVAGRLAASFPEKAVELAKNIAEGDFAANLPALLWARGLALAAVVACAWQEEEDFALAQAFAVIEKSFLARYYAPELLCAENIGLLPPMHALGWYCAQAFAALENGDARGYVRLLRQGLEFCPEQKNMVKFLAENTPELQERPEPSAEIQALAERIRAVLSAYSPDDPAVAELKKSATYQQIAHLIEGNVISDTSGYVH